jgi:dolichyl-phosphate-mannose--protein O-mannosyl transferase
LIRNVLNFHLTLREQQAQASHWWQWPLLAKPISYYYIKYPPFASYDPAQQPLHLDECCIARLQAISNPAVLWFGLVSVPLVAALAWLRRGKAYLLIAVAYFVQWLPWSLSPRETFQYHFYPNVALIVLADTIVLQQIWNAGRAGIARALARGGVSLYLVLVAVLFLYFFPMVAGSHISWHAWRSHMWFHGWVVQNDTS